MFVHAGSKTNAVTVVASAASKQQQQSVDRLVPLGYSAAAADAALRRSGGDELAALRELYRQLTGQQYSMCAVAWLYVCRGSRCKGCLDIPSIE